MGYVSLANLLLGSKKQGLKTEDQMLNFQIPVYAFK